MQITKISFKKPQNPQSTALAQCTMAFDNCFVVSGFKMCNGKNGAFLAMPSFKDRDTGKHVDTSFPITKEYRTILMNAASQAYNKWVQNGCPEPAPKAGTGGYPHQQAPQATPQQAAADYGIQWGQPQTTPNGIQFVQGVPTQAFIAAWGQNQAGMEQQGWSLMNNIVYKSLTPPPQQQAQQQEIECPY